MIERFQSACGLSRLHDALLAQRLVAYDQTLASLIAERGELVEYAACEAIIEQGSEDNCVYLLLYGEARVLVNGRPVAVRRAGESVGDMALVDPSANRSATVMATGAVVAVRLSEEHFRSIADRHPAVWRHLCLILSSRLRERAQFHREPNREPIVFVGCSAEGLRVAEQIQLGLKHAPFQTRVWSNGVFGPSSIPVDALLDAVHASDFGCFVFSPDDVVESRASRSTAPRDNVVLELGLFLGHLGRERTFIVRDRDTDIRFPTDLLGVTPLTYVTHEGEDLAVAVAPLCTELRTVVERLGVR